MNNTTDPREMSTNVTPNTEVLYSQAPTVISSSETWLLNLISTYISIIGFPVIILFGTFGNVMTVVIMRKMTSSSKDSSINVYFTSLAVVDTICLMNSTFFPWVNLTFGFDVNLVHTVMCKVRTWLSVSSQIVSIWLLVALTLQRAISVAWPHKVDLLCPRSAALRVVIVIVAFFSFVYTIHILVANDILEFWDRKRCVPESPEYLNFLKTVIFQADIFVMMFLPFFCIAAGNLVLVFNLVRALKRARMTLTSGSGSDQLETRSKAINSVTLTVVAVSLIFLILLTPNTVYHFTVFGQLNTARGMTYARLYFFQTMTRLLRNANYAVNFYIYSLTGRRFREEFFKVMGCGKGQGQSSNSQDVSSFKTENSSVVTRS